MLAQVPASLLELVRGLLQTRLSKLQESKVLPSVLRALRNILVSAADAVWGHVWGVGAERKVIGTGLVGGDLKHVAEKGKGVSVRKDVWRYEATKALSSVFEVRAPSPVPERRSHLTLQFMNLSTLLSVLQTHDHPQIVLPIYQLLSRLVVLPSHREALARWETSHGDIDNARAGPSGLRLIDPAGSMLFPIPSPPKSGSPFILQHLVDIVVHSTSRKVTPKALEAALELLAALVKGQHALAGTVRSWMSDGHNEEYFDSVMPPGSPFPGLRSPTFEKEPRLPEMFTLLLDLMATSGTSVRIAAASW